MPFECCRRRIIGICRNSLCMARGGITKQVAAVSRRDCKMELGILLSNCFDNDNICVDSFGSGFLVKLSIDTIASFRRLDGHLAGMGAHCGQKSGQLSSRSKRRARYRTAQDAEVTAQGLYTPIAAIGGSATLSPFGCMMLRADPSISDFGLLQDSQSTAATLTMVVAAASFTYIAVPMTSVMLVLVDSEYLRKAYKRLGR